MTEKTGKKNDLGKLLGLPPTGYGPAKLLFGQFQFTIQTRFRGLARWGCYEAVYFLLLSAEKLELFHTGISVQCYIAS